MVLFFTKNSSLLFFLLDVNPSLTLLQFDKKIVAIHRSVRIL